MADSAPPQDLAPTAFFGTPLSQRDGAVFAAIEDEQTRQQEQIELIASENIVSQAVLEAQGTVLTNKYAEGYAGRRYYGGCEYVDVVETLAIDRAKALFHCGFANVQPNSGSQANQAVFQALIKPGDTILGMSLDAGGHLTHGARPNQSGKWFNAVQYGVRREDDLIDFDEVATLAREHKPQMIIAGGSAYPRQIDFAKFRAIADEVGAYFLVDMAHFSGLVAGGHHPNPLDHAHVATTTTHKTLRGPRGGMVLTNDEKIAKKVNSAVFPGIQGGPLMHVIAGKAVAFGEALSEDYKAYTGQVIKNAQALAAAVKAGGLDVVSGGTDTHLALIDFEEVAALAREHKPQMIIAGGSAYPRQIDFAKFRAIADEVGAYFLVDMAHFSGLVAGGHHPNPLDHAHVATTTTHKTLRGPRGGMVLTNDEKIAKKVNSAVFPGIQGGPLMQF